MLLGIRKRQWPLLLLVLMLTLLMNALAILQDVGMTSIRKMWMGSYKSDFSVVPGNPLPEISAELLLIVAVSGLPAWLMIYTSDRTLFRRQSGMLRVDESLFMALLMAAIFGIASGYVRPLVWLPVFHAYLLGLPASDLMLDWSYRLILPATAAVLLFAMRLSEGETESR
jgi:hypothetical protein